MIDLGRFLRGGLALALLLAAPAAAEDRGLHQVKKSLKEADAKWSDGDADAAVKLYEAVLAATEPGAPERAGALYALAVDALSPDSPRRDHDRARALLAEYESLPRPPHRLEVRTLAALMESAESARVESRRLEDELAREREDRERERRELGEKSGETESSLEAEVETLTGKLAEAEEMLASKDAEVRTLREELAKKEEALEKLRQRVVGRSGG